MVPEIYPVPEARVFECAQLLITQNPPAHAPKPTQIHRIVLAVDTATSHNIPVTIGCLAWILGINHSGASRAVHSGVEHQYLEIRPMAQDHRQREVRLTPSGQHLLKLLHSQQKEALGILTAELSHEQLEVFGEVVIHLTKHLLKQISPRSGSEDE